MRHFESTMGDVNHLDIWTYGIKEVIKQRLKIVVISGLSTFVVCKLIYDYRRVNLQYLFGTLSFYSTLV